MMMATIEPFRVTAAKISMACVVRIIVVGRVHFCHLTIVVAGLSDKSAESFGSMALGLIILELKASGISIIFIICCLFVDFHTLFNEANVKGILIRHVIHACIDAGMMLVIATTILALWCILMAHQIIA